MQSDAAHLPPPQVETLADLFRWRVQASPSAIAYRQFDPRSKGWQELSWRDIGEAVGRWQGSLRSLGLPAGSRVAILLPNGTAAVAADLGSLTAGLVPVPLHSVDNPGSIAYILRDSDASVLVLESRAQWDAIASVGDSMPALRLVVMVGETPESPSASSAATPMLASAQSWLVSRPTDDAGAGPQAENLAAIVYTSGTTGKPKGVMLTHRNVMANIRSVLAQVPANADDMFLSFLPLSHTFERTAGYYLPIAAGSCVTYSRSVAQIADDLQLVRPTVLISVPRIYERFFAKIQEAMSHQSGLTRWMFAAAVRAGWRRFCRAQTIPFAGGAPAWIDALIWPMFDMLVARKIRQLFGGRVRIAVSGGAPLSAAVAQCFLGLGLPLLQGYGMTETSPVVAANTLDDNWPETVGRALQGIEVRIGDSAELQVRGDCVMKGYWKRPQDTENVTTADGWLRTGDQAALEAGRIRIIGRIKEIIVTSTGEKIAPGDLELAITADPLFDQAYVLGEGRPFLAAFVVLSREQWKMLAQSAGIVTDGTGDAIVNSGPARKAVLRRIQAATSRFPHYAVPRAVWATLEPWTIQNGLMTPTLKLKRNNLQSRYQTEIDALYSGHKPAA